MACSAKAGAEVPDRAGEAAFAVVREQGGADDDHRRRVSALGLRRDLDPLAELAPRAVRPSPDRARPRPGSRAGGPTAARTRCRPASGVSPNARTPTSSTYEKPASQRATAVSRSSPTMRSAAASTSSELKFSMRSHPYPQRSGVAEQPIEAGREGEHGDGSEDRHRDPADRGSHGQGRSAPVERQARAVGRRPVRRRRGRSPSPPRTGPVACARPRRCRVSHAAAIVAETRTTMATAMAADGQHDPVGGVVQGRARPSAPARSA